MKKLHILALTMLLSTTSAVIMEANYDTDHGLNKKRNNNTYDGSGDACDGYYIFEDDGYDTFDEKEHLNKKRNSEEHPTCTAGCSQYYVELPVDYIEFPDERVVIIEETTDDSVKVQCGCNS